MEEYIRYMNKEDTKRVVKILLCCAALFFTFAGIAYANTRFNGFADVQPASYYFGYLKWLWERIVANLFLYPKRFINFFN